MTTHLLLVGALHACAWRAEPEPPPASVFDDVLAAEERGDFRPWGLLIGRDAAAHRALAGPSGVDPRGPQVTVHADVDADGAERVYGFDVSLPRRDDVDAIVAAWGAPAFTLRHDGSPHANGVAWTSQAADASGWFLSRFGLLATVWTPVAGDAAPRMVVRSRSNPGAVLASATACAPWGYRLGRPVDQLVVHRGHWRIGDAPSIRVPSLGPTDLRPRLTYTTLDGVIDSFTMHIGDHDGLVERTLRELLAELEPTDDGAHWCRPTSSFTEDPSRDDGVDGVIGFDTEDGALRLTVRRRVGPHPMPQETP